MTTLYLWGKPLVPVPTNTSIPPLEIQHPVPFDSISCGNTHCLMSTEEGVYGIGDNSEGQLGLGNKANNTGARLLRIQIASRNAVVAVSCGWNYSLMLDAQRNVYSAGKGENGELGRGKVTNSMVFGFVMQGARQISAGKDHALALTGSKVYGWGNSREGQLGLLNTKHYHTPQQLNVYPTHSILAGPKYSIFCTSKGLYATGLNSDYQLGQGHNNSVQVPRRLAIEETIVEAVGGSYIAAQTKNTQWYLWGTGTFGTFKYPTKMSFMKGAEKVALGQTFGVFMREGQVWFWGVNCWGELAASQKIQDYAVESDYFSSLAFSGFATGQNYFAAFSNGQHFYQTRQSQLQSLNQSHLKYQIDRKEMKMMGSSSSSSGFYGSRNLFDKYYRTHQADTIKESKPRVYSEQMYQEAESQGSSYQKSYGSTTMPKVKQHSTPGWVQKKYVHLPNPIKYLQGSYSEQLEKENQLLKERLELQMYQKQNLQQQYQRRLNSYERSKVDSKMQKLESLAASPKNIKGNLFAHQQTSPKHEEHISFRPNIENTNTLKRMGDRIQSLKSLLTGMAQ